MNGTDWIKHSVLAVVLAAALAAPAGLRAHSRSAATPSAESSEISASHKTIPRGNPCAIILFKTVQLLDKGSFPD